MRTKKGTSGRSSRSLQGQAARRSVPKKGSGRTREISAPATSIIVRDTDGNIYWFPGDTLHPLQNAEADQLIYRLIAEKCSRLIDVNFAMVSKKSGSLDEVLSEIRTKGTK
ncbi:MAG: hypothetical protein U1E53_05110 [Dongiaceae bacterium]